MSLPPGWRLRVDPATRRLDGGRVLVGGAPLRLLRLNAAAAKVVDRLDAGDEVGEGSGAQQLARRLLDAGMAHPVPDAARLGRGDVTLVVPIHGEPAELDATLGRTGGAGAVVVVDDASPDAAGVAAVAARHGARLLRHEENRGPGAARNTGWAVAATEVVAFLDADCTPVEGWLEHLLPHFDDPAVVAVAPRIVTDVVPELPAALAAYEHARPTLDRGPAEATVRPKSRVPFVPTAALLVRRAALESAGGFEVGLRFGEDVDLVWRLVDAGGTVRYDPGTTVTHGSRSSVGGWLRQRFLYGTSAAPLARRHGPKVAPVAVSPWTAVAWGLAAAGAPVTGVAVAAGSSALLAPRLDGIEHPWREAGRLAGLGNLYGGLALSDALRRPWWPLALVGVVASRRFRRAAVAAVVVPPLLEWRRTRPPLDPVTWTALRLVDDVAYGAGVWAGCWQERSLAALAPDLTSWPGRTPAVEPT